MGKMNKEKIRIFLVDDDSLYLKSLEIEFKQYADFVVDTYATGELCMENIRKDPDIIILDYHLDGIEINAMNGIETLGKIKAHNQKIAVIMLSSQDKIDVAINCMHHKALDYVVKSETAFTRLQTIITSYYKYQQMEKQLNWYMERM